MRTLSNRQGSPETSQSSTSSSILTTREELKEILTQCLVEINGTGDQVVNVELDEPEVATSCPLYFLVCSYRLFNHYKFILNESVRETLEYEEIPQLTREERKQIKNRIVETVLEKCLAEERKSNFEIDREKWHKIKKVVKEDVGVKLTNYYYNRKRKRPLPSE